MSASLPFQFTAEDVISQGRTSRKNIEAVRVWLDNCENFVPKILPDEMVVLFLLACEDDVEFTKTTIKSHYKLKMECSDIHDNRNTDSEDMRQVFDIWTLAILPVRTDNNCAIHYITLKDGDYSKFSVAPIMKATLMLVDLTLEKDPPDGFIIIVDTAETSLMHLTKIKFDLVMKYLQFLQDGLPMKLRALHYVNSNSFVSKVFALVRRLIKGDIMKLIHFHPPNVNMDKFYEHVPRKCLPSDLGGELPSVTELSSKTYEQFRSRQEFWNLEEAMRKQFQQK